MPNAVEKTKIAKHMRAETGSVIRDYVSVSYTHLDVYKRQGIYISSSGIFFQLMLLTDMILTFISHQVLSQYKLSRQL